MSTGTSSAPVPEESSDEDNDGLEFDTDREPAMVSRAPDGQIRGVAIYLSGDDLRSLGVNKDVEAVVPSIYQGTLVLRAVQAE